MPENFKAKIIRRVIDANINRAKEGLRVCEEVTRFILESRSLTRELKKIRHKLDALTRRLPGLPAGLLLKERRSASDIGKNIYVNELKRKGINDIFFANMQRAKESIRVLEEFAKLADKNIAIGFKKIRYAVYEAEKKAAFKIAPLRYR